MKPVMLPLRLSSAVAYALLGFCRLQFALVHSLLVQTTDIPAPYPVEEIEYMITERGVPDAFMGLILIPLVEKAAEHLTAVDEAWDNQMNFALAHILGATVQTALFNSSLAVIVGWGLHKAMDLNFEVFNIVILIMAIVVVGNFLRDQKSNYLEGSLCILIYILIGRLPQYFAGSMGC
jgi:Ca2+:H+ antiporter